VVSGMLGYCQCGSRDSERILVWQSLRRDGGQLM
jgi:hypothetical protein